MALSDLTKYSVTRSAHGLSAIAELLVLHSVFEGSELLPNVCIQIYAVSWHNLLFDSFVTPPLRVDADRPSRSAQRSLDFGRSRLNSDPVPTTSDPLHLSNHSCPDMSWTSRQPQRARTPVGDDTLPRRQSVGSTTVKALVTPIAQRLQSSSSVTPPCRSCAPPAHIDYLDQTLTDAGSPSERYNLVTAEAGGPAACQTVVESSPSRWSASDYFHRYPNARLDSTSNTTRDGSPYCESGLQRVTDARHTLRQQTVDGNTTADADASTLISSISPARRLCPCSAPSVEGSVETSSSLDSISTNDDAAFRAGLAQLDANIAVVQRRLRGSSSNLSSACHSHSPRANCDHCT